MPKTIGFDNDLYLKQQTEAILKRVENSGKKLYLEFGGKLLFDGHAARVLPGFDPNVKMRLLQGLAGKSDLILCIHAGDIERKKVRADFGITYDSDALKLMDDLREAGVGVTAVVVTRFDDQPAAKVFQSKLERRSIPVFVHRVIPDYPGDLDSILSDEGYGVNEYIQTQHPLVVVTAPGPSSGKLSTCFSQLYHEYKAGRQAGYAKFETFPIWNLPLEHPVNLAYEAATADIADINMVDPFHLKAYGQVAVNYNRDVEMFPVVQTLLQRIRGVDPGFKSPTDMGVNCAGFGIVDDAVVQEAAKQEIIRRFFRYRCEYSLGFIDKAPVDRLRMLMNRLDLSPEDRCVVGPARRAAMEAQQTGKGHGGIFCGAAIELPDGRIITGKNSPIMHAASSLVLNAAKALALIPDHIHLLPPNIMESIGAFKKQIVHKDNVSLDLGETLIALSVSVATNPAAHLAMEKLGELQGCEVHMSHMPTPGDEVGLRRLGVNLTSDPNFPSKNLFLT